ncbi:uncharacterized protein [Diabrotica undecimpunctata]|uniref:uncharacterized protein n=1 Tax=Diabrotica undecimpunctata TaxID=50387 RepID=UPI003B641136
MLLSKAIIFFLITTIDEALCVCNRIGDAVKCSEEPSLRFATFNDTKLGNLSTVKYFQYYSANRSQLWIQSTFMWGFKNVEIIKITHTDMRRLVSDTFYSHTECRELHLPDNNIAFIDVNAFGYLNKLTHLLLNQNALTAFNPITIGLAYNLKYLDLGHNRINKLPDTALYNLENLTYINLNGNRLKEIKLNKIVSFPKSIKVVWLSENLLLQVTRQFFADLVNIEVLNLSYNKIDSLVEAFNDLTNLKTLILTHNMITQFVPFLFPPNGLPKLENLAIDHNYVMVPPSILDVLPNLKKITIMGNPWYCNCLRDFREELKKLGIQEKCDSDYVDTERPICISDHMSNNTCNTVYNPQAAHNFVNDDKKLALDTDIAFCLISEFS